MLERLNQIKKAAEEALQNAKDELALEKERVKFLGRKSELTHILRGLKDLAIEEKRKVGPLVQNFKKELEELIENKRQTLTSNLQHQTSDVFDITKPGKKVKTGHLHPLTIIQNQMRDIFSSLNFSVVEGPEVETEYYNFDALNIPPDHPARDMWDTFWLRQNEIKNQKSPKHPDKSGATGQAKIKNDDKLKTQGLRLLLRTHTSPVQIRYMETHEPPIQIIVPGRVFRYEATDASHEINFYQLEGLMVGSDISLANFKFIVEHFFKKFLGSDIDFRFRPSYFPFTEPSLEVDIKFKGKWLEVMGAGMVHPNVFRAVKYDPGKMQGFAFGVGIDRLAMIKYNIPDIRFFYSGDLRFIEQF